MTTAAAPPAERAAATVPARSRDVGAQVFAVVVLLFSTGAFFANLPPLQLGESRPQVLLLWVLAYGIAGVMLLDGLLRRRSAVSCPPELVLFLAVAALSVLWSISPDLTLRRVVGLLGTVLVGLVIASRLTPVEVLEALRVTALVIAVTSLLLYASGSATALDVDHGTLRGVLSTKNVLGRVLALGLLATAAVGLLDRGRARTCVLSALPMLAALSLTGSTGGYLLAAAIGAGTVLVLLLRRPAGRLAVLALAALALGLAALLAPALSAEDLAGAVGEDTTLTGRDEVWEQSLLAMSERPVLGYGYGAFWTVSVEAERIRARLQWLVPHAHNGLLDIGLDLGVVGLLSAAAVVVGLVARGLADLRRHEPERAVLRLSVAWFLVLSNLVESGLLQQNILLTVLLVTALGARARPGSAPVGGRRSRGAVAAASPR